MKKIKNWQKANKNRDRRFSNRVQGQSFAIYDLERVVILKAPQGTLFGRNATGGLIHYITRKPTFETEGYLDFTYGAFDTSAHASRSRQKAGLAGLFAIEWPLACRSDTTTRTAT